MRGGRVPERKINKKSNLLLSYELVEEVSHGRAPVEMGISVNKTWMLENNISDINVYFKDPINNVPFISPKETYPEVFIFNISYIFVQFKVYDPRFVDDYETVFILKSSIIEKLEEVDNCRHYSKG